VEEGRLLTTRSWAETWQRSWDEFEERHVPDRDLWIAALLDVVDAIGVESPKVLDLACGTGTITRRLLQGQPTARSIAVDVDPVLLTIASATFDGDDRVRIVRADVRDPTWVDALPDQYVDATITATALHWLTEHAVRRLYGDLARLVRSGGVVAHAEVMPWRHMPVLGTRLARLERQRHSSHPPDGISDWDAWWKRAAHDPLLEAACKERRAVFSTNYPTHEFSPPAEWHIAALRDAGFSEAGVVWRSGTGAVVAALR
jgi:SAM-dependent methyltransferase